MDVLVSLVNLAVRLPAGRNRVVRAVDGVTLDVRRGEILGLVGESGYGKTTLGRALAGLVRPTAGEIVRHGDVRTQLVFQDPYSSLDPQMTVAASIGEGVRDRAPAARVGQLMELVGLTTRRWAPATRTSCLAASASASASRARSAPTRTLRRRARR